MRPGGGEDRGETGGKAGRPRRLGAGTDWGAGPGGVWARWAAIPGGIAATGGGESNPGLAEAIADRPNGAGAGVF